MTVAVVRAEGSVVGQQGAARCAGRTELSLTGHSFGQVWKGAAICAVVFGGTAASSALSYASTFPDAASRAQVAALTSGDPGLTVLLGPTAATGTVGGYTVYKGFAFLTTIGAVWAVLAATRLLRGEEDAGRWHLVLAGATRAGRATAATVVALLGAVATIFAGTFVIIAAAGRTSELAFSVRDSAIYALSLALVPAVFVAVGAVAAQVGRTRRAASMIAVGAISMAYVVRMVADSSPSWHWLRWTTPFGWSELIEPFTGNDLRPVAAAVIAIVSLTAMAVVLSAHRDVGQGAIASSDVSTLRPFGLASVLGLGVRLEGPAVAAWWLGATACAFLMGMLASLTTTSIPDSMTSMLERFGARGAFTDQYFGVVFLLMATVVSLLPASQVASVADEELSGRLVHVVASPTSRTRWFAGRLGLVLLAVIVAGVLTGLGAWAGARSQGIEADLGDLVVAGANVVPTALLVLGIGAAVLAVAPRAASTVAYAVVAWSLIVDLLSTMVSGLTWLGPFSIFHRMALAPAEDIRWSSIGLTFAISFALCLAAAKVFGRRGVAPR